ncbi:MAG: hypothetical protein ACE5JA_00150 [bacterium]
MRLLCAVALLSFSLMATPASSQELDSTEVELFLRSLVETAGQAISGGVLWSANTHGGLPHFSLGIGTNVVSVRADNPVIPGETLSAAVPIVFAMGSIGVLKGLNPNPIMGGIGSVDVIGRFGYFPATGDYREYAKWAPAIFGGGVRIGLLRSSILAPAVSFSVAYVRISQMRYEFEDPEASAVARINLSTLSLHGDVSKNLLLVTPYAGIGWDKHYFKADWDVDFIDPANPDAVGAINLRPESWRLYAGLEIPLVIMHLNVEGGVTGGNGYFAAGGRIGI